MMAEVRIRILDSPSKAEIAESMLQELIAPVNSSLGVLGRGRYRANDVAWDARCISRAGLQCEIESENISRAKNILYCLVIPPGWEPGRYDPSSLILAHPESSFVWLPLNKDGSVRMDFTKFCLLDRKDITERIVNFLLGERFWFDSLGVRRSIRSSSACDSSPVVALIVEDETEYSDLLGYVALRTGAFSQINTVRSEGRLRLFQQQQASIENHKGKGEPEAGLEGEHLTSSGVLIHSMDCAFPDYAEWAMAGVDALHAETWKRLAELTGLHRSSVSSASPNETILVDPHKWNGPDLKIAMDKGRVRGVRKPLGWIHDVLASGLFDFNGCRTSHSGYDVYRSLGLQEPSPVHDGNHLSHSANGWSQAIAQELLGRSRKALAEGEAILSATMALEAARLLGGQSVTLFLDAMTALYISEAQAETCLACAAHGGRTPIRRRAQELDRVAAWLQQHALASDEMLRDQTTRIWLALRSVYQQAGAFDAADEVLLQVHRTESDVRWGTGPATLPDEPSSSSIFTDEETTVGPLTDAEETKDTRAKPVGSALRRLWNAIPTHCSQILNARELVGVVIRWAVWVAVPLICASLAVFGNKVALRNTSSVVAIMLAALAVLLWGPDPFKLSRRKVARVCGYVLAVAAVATPFAAHLLHNSHWRLVTDRVWPTTDHAVAALGILGLSWLLTKGPDGIGWLALALMPSRWLVAAALSIALLGAANWTTYCKNGDVACDADLARGIPLSMVWTTGQMLGVNSPQALVLESDSDKETRFQLERASPTQYLLWFEDTFTGWSLFALGLSAIYRKATRG